MVAVAASTSAVALPDFFLGSDYLIDERMRPSRTGPEYNVYDASGAIAGRIHPESPAWHRFGRLFLKKHLFPFSFALVDEHRQRLVSVSRGWTFRMSRISIRDGNGNDVGSIRLKRNGSNARFKVYSEGRKIAEINGDWKSWSFTITDREHMPVGAIDKKWAGLTLDTTSTSDRYHLSINSTFTNPPSRLLLIATAITIDMVLKASQ
jgi:uncharacterized protein YxjI